MSREHRIRMVFDGTIREEDYPDIDFTDPEAAIQEIYEQYGFGLRETLELVDWGINK